jgi:hypothetical protein
VAISLTATQSETKGRIVLRLKCLQLHARLSPLPPALPPPHTCSLAEQENGTGFVDGKECVIYSVSYSIFTIYLQGAGASNSVQTKAIVFLEGLLEGGCLHYSIKRSFVYQP